MRNHDSSDQATLFHLSLVHSLCSWVHCMHSWQWSLVNRGTLVGCMLCSPISNSVCWTVCFETLALGPALYWTVSWATVWHQFWLTKWDSLWRPFSLIMQTSNTLASTADFTIIYPLWLNTNSRSRTTYQLGSFGNTHSQFLGHYNQPSIKFTWISNLSHHSQKCKKNSVSSPAAVK